MALKVCNKYLFSEIVLSASIKTRTVVGFYQKSFPSNPKMDFTVNYFFAFSILSAVGLNEMSECSFINFIKI